MVRKLSINLLIAAAGLVFGLAVVELGLAVLGLPPAGAQGEDGEDRMHYIYTNTGLGKCYPSDPRDYFPYDMTTDDDFSVMSELIADVADLPDEWSREEKIAHLREAAPYCNNVPLVPLNKGVDMERPRQVLLIGDSFTFGEGLRLEDTIGYQLAGLMSGTSFPNMGWPGTSIATIFDVSKGVERFDAVVYFYNINDILKTEELSHRSYELHGVYRPIPDVDADAPRFCGYLRLCRLIRQRDRRLEKSRASIEYYRDLYFSEENAEPRRESFEKLAAMQRDAERQGTRLIVAMFPLFYRPPFSDYPFHDIHEYVRREAERLGIPFLDLLPIYEEYLFWDDLMVHPLDRHPSAEAIRAAAQYLAEELPPLLVD